MRDFFPPKILNKINMCAYLDMYLPYKYERIPTLSYISLKTGIKQSWFFQMDIFQANSEEQNQFFVESMISEIANDSDFALFCVQVKICFPVKGYPSTYKKKSFRHIIELI